jgi:hypothetical protein
MEYIIDERGFGIPPLESFIIFDYEYMVVNRSSGKYYTFNNIAKHIEWLDNWETAWPIASAEPELQKCHYSEVPARNYWAPQYATNEPEWLTYQANNDDIKVIADRMDCLMPSLYTFYANASDENLGEPSIVPDSLLPDGERNDLAKDHVAGWEKYIRGNVSEARRIADGKAVYCVLWPRYHDSNVQRRSDGKRIRYQILNQGFFEFQLGLVRELCDGLMIWDNPIFFADKEPDPKSLPLDWNNGNAGANQDVDWYPWATAFKAANP